MPVMTYFLTPGELGVFNIIMVTSSMLVPLFSMNLTDGPAIHFVQEKSHDRIIAMYNTVTNSVFLFSIAFLPLLWLIMFYFGGDYYRHLPLIIVMIYANLFYKLVSYVLVVFQKTSFLVKNTVQRDSFATVLTIIVVVAGYSYYGMVAVLALTNTVAALLVYRYIRKDLVYSCAIDRRILRQFLKTSLPLLPVFFFSWVVQSSDTYFLAYFLDQEAVGKYSVIYGLTNVILCLTYALNFFWFPVSARLWVENREKYLQVFTALFAGFVTVLFVAVVLFELNASMIMKLLVRRQEYHDAYFIMGTISFAFAMQVIITLLTAPLYSNNNTKTIFASYLCGGVVNAILNFLLIPFAGLTGAAVSTAVSYLVIVFLMAIMNYRMARFAFFDVRLVPVSAVFIVVWTSSALLRDSLQTCQLLATDTAFVLSAAVLLYALVLKSNEKEYLVAMYKKFRLNLKKA